MKFIKYPSKAQRPNFAVKLVADALNFRFGLDDLEPSDITVNLQDLVDRHSQDHGCVVIGIKDESVLAYEANAMTVSTRLSPHSRPQGSIKSSTPLSTYREAGGADMPLAYLLTPTKGCALEECTLYFFAEDKPMIITSEGSSLVAEDGPVIGVFLQTWLPISLEGDGSVNAGQATAFKVRAPEGAVVFLEATAGVLNRSRAINGDVVTLDANGLRSGETLRIKAGYRFWPSKVEKSYTVRA